MVASADDGIVGTDHIDVQNGDITIHAGGDGLKSASDEASGTGHVTIEDGVLAVTSEADGIQAETNVAITGGKITLLTGGGSGAFLGQDATAKGIKATIGLDIGGGEFFINSADDALHSNGNLVIDGGTFSLTSGDDAIHGDTKITINGGKIGISKSYEGIESKSITINDGDIMLVSSDDGINTSDGSRAMTGNWPLYVNGGHTVVYAGGDGADANGPVTMTGGDVIVHGPTRNDNGALDHNTFKISGGLVVAASSSGMAQAPGGQTSTQYAVLVNFTSTLGANTLFHIRKSDGTEIVTFRPSKTYQSIGFSSDALARDATYDAYTGGSSTGTATDGLYEGGTYSGGTKYKSFTISSLVTTVGGGGGAARPPVVQQVMAVGDVQRLLILAKGGDTPGTSAHFIWRGASAQACHAMVRE